jgi:hypothetical protein
MNNCQFCGQQPKHIWHGEIISYQCGTVAGDQLPRTLRCKQKTVAAWKQDAEPESKSDAARNDE